MSAHRDIDRRSSKGDTSIFESRHIDLQKSTHRFSKIEGRNITPTIRHRILSTTALQILRVDEVTHAHTIDNNYNNYIYYLCSYVFTCINNTGTATHARPHTCTSYVLNAYLYCVYALVGGAISIRDSYICAVFHGSVPTNRTLFSTGPLSVQLKRSYRLHASIIAYFVGKKALGRRSCSR